ncbi:MAG: efflux RND transporter permease subunit [Firmicutes bacterium]|nr:efflux RND transporter permease subunit [Bacillota bacterium]
MTKYSVKKPLTIIVAVIVIIVLGVVSFMRLTPDLLPSIDLPYVMVMTTYPGATPEEVEEQVTKPLEQSLATVENLKTLMSSSSPSYSLVMMEFENGSSMDAAVVDVLQQVDMVEGSWGENIGSPYILKINPTMIPIMIAAVDRDGYDLKEVSEFTTDKLLTALEGTNGVASVRTGGLLESKVNVLIDGEKIENLNNQLIASINEKIAEARSQIESGIAQVDSALAQIDAQERQLNAAKQSAIGGIQSAINQLYAQAAQAGQAAAGVAGTISGYADAASQSAAEIAEALANLSPDNMPSPDDLAKFAADTEAALAELQTNLQNLSNVLNNISMPSIPSAGQINSSISAAFNGMDSIYSAQTQLAVARSQLMATRQQLTEALTELDQQAEEALKAADLPGMITIQTVSQILMAQNFDMPAGYIQNEEGARFLVSVGDKLADVDEVESLILFNIEGLGDIHVRDVAQVFVSDNSESTYASINGNTGVLLTFLRQSNSSTTATSDNLKKTFRELEAKYDGLRFSVLMDQGDYIYLVIEALLQSLGYGALFAILVLLLFLRDLRPTFITLLSIPISLMFAVVLMYFSGVTINLISLSGLAVSVGMLVDNSIVVIENIYRMRSLGIDRLRAAVAGAKEVGAAITSSTLTTICVFVPIVFVQGLTRQLFSDMALTITYSLLTSLVIALTLVPALASRMLKREPRKAGRTTGAIMEGYKRLLNWNLNHKLLLSFVVVILLIFSVQTALSRGFVFLPDMTTPQMGGTITMNDEDATIRETGETADKVLRIVEKIDGVKVAGSMLSTNSEYGSFLGNTADNIADIYVVLEDDTKRTSKEIADEIREKTKGLPAKVEITTTSSITEYTTALGGKGVTINLFSNDSDALKKAARMVGDRLAKVEGIKSVDNGLTEAETEYHFIIDKAKAIRNGLTVAQVYAAVAQEVTFQQTATTMTIGGESYDVVVSKGNGTEITLDSLMNPEVAEGVLLKDVSNMVEEESLPAIDRLDQETYLAVTAEIEEGSNITLITDKCIQATNELRLPQSVRLEYSGENETIMEAMRDLFKMMLVGIILVYLIMVAQFQSFKSPFIVMFTIPLAFTGGFLALIIFNKEVSVVSMMGLIILNGVVVNNGIVLVDYINQLRARGMNKRAALITAGATRMRPVLMTSVTTILGLIVLAAGKSAGTDMMQPLALVCIGGLAYATLLTLLVVPVIYDIMNGESFEYVRAEDVDVSDLIIN